MEKEEKLEIAIRPALIEEYIGQKEVKDNMKVFIEAAKIRGESLDHVLLYGPPQETSKHHPRQERCQRTHQQGEKKILPISIAFGYG